MSAGREIISYRFNGKYTMSCDLSIDGVVARNITVVVTNPPYDELHVTVPTQSEAGDLIDDKLQAEFSTIAKAVFWGVEDAVGVKA